MTTTLGSPDESRRWELHALARVASVTAIK
jgi:hypothetical protein